MNHYEQEELGYRVMYCAIVCVILQDALVMSNLSSTREFHACGDNYTKYYGSVRSLHTVVDSQSPLAVIKTMFDLSLLKSPTVILICVSGFLSFAGQSNNTLQ